MSETTTDHGGRWPRDDDALAEDLTEVLRGTPGLVDVFDARPRREIAAAAVEQGVGRGLEALGLDAPGVDVGGRSSGAGPRGLVHVVRRADGHGTATAHVATDLAASTPVVLAEAAARLRRHLADLGERPDAWAVRVVARLVDGEG